jgi:hypothetical protein
MKRHRFDPFAFLFGALFLTVGLTAATGGSGADAVRSLRSWPTAVILTGVVLVVWTVSRVLRSGATEPNVEAGGTSEVATAQLVGRDPSESDPAERDETRPP